MKILTLCLLALVLGYAQPTMMVYATDCTPPPLDLVSWWPGDGEPADVVGGNDGSLMNGTTFAPGKVDQAFSLDGIDDFVEVADSGNLDILDGITLEAWISPRELHLGPIVTKWGPNSGYNLHFRGDMGGGIVQGQIGTGAAFPVINSTRTVPLNQFSHVAFTYDGSTMRIYINGILDGSTSTTGSIVPNDMPLKIGTNLPAAYEYFFSGLIDEVSIFSRALDALEVQAIFQAGSKGKCRFAVNGRVVNEETGVPIEEALVIAVQRPARVKTTSNVDGSYEIGGLSEGVWRLLCWKRGYQFQVQTVTLTGGVETVDFALKPKVTGSNDEIPLEFREYVSTAPRSPQVLATIWSLMKKRH